MSDAALRFERVDKAYAGAPALAGFSLQVAPGECFGLVGENGAGKTTLLKCLLDFCAIDGGAIEIFGVPHRLTRARARLAFLPERFTPPHYVAGRDFLRYMARLHRGAYDEARARATLAALDLDPRALDRPARTYSKGMTQMLGLAACLLSDKALQILDEPASGLDPKARAALKRELKGLRAAGRTVFLTSHALPDVEEMCDRLGVIHRGRLLFAGSPAQLVQRYRAPNVEAAFLACIAEPAAA